MGDSRQPGGPPPGDRPQPGGRRPSGQPSGQPLPPGVRQPDPTLGKLRPVVKPGQKANPKASKSAAKPKPGSKARQVAGKVKPSVVKPRKQASVERMAAPLTAAEIDPPTRPKRQRVVLADQSPAGRAPSLRARVELAQQTSWGEMLIRDLIRAQLRSGLALGLVVLLLLCALPLTFAMVPSFASFTFAGVPMAWLVLGVLPFPLLFAVGLWYNRLAERHERAFVDMIEN